MSLKFLTKGLYLVIVVIFLSACATSQLGNTKIDDQGKYMQLQINESEKRDVYLVFGQPHYVAYESDEKSAWLYERLNLTGSGWSFVPVWGLFFGGINKEHKVAVFEFSEKGILKNVSSSESGGFVNSWVGMAGGGFEDHKPKNASSVQDEMEKYSLPYLADRDGNKKE
jgi:hypothetical protein